MPACRKTGSWRETLRVIRNLLVGIAILIAILVLVPAGVLGGIIAWLKLSPPATSGQVSLPGLAQPVDLVWDHNAVPHIFAGSLRDAYRTLGWAHARDRLWQMETQRRIGQGRLAELVGSLGLAFDKEMRVLGVYRLAEANYAAARPRGEGGCRCLCRRRQRLSGAPGRAPTDRIPAAARHPPNRGGRPTRWSGAG